MDEATVRKSLDEVRAEFDRVEEQRSILLALLNAYEGWLQLNANGRHAQLSFPAEQGEGESEATPRATDQENRPSFRRAAIQVLRDGRGALLHTGEIWRRMLALGVVSTAKRPENFIVLNYRTVPQAEKVAPKQFRWVEAA